MKMTTYTFLRNALAVLVLLPSPTLLPQTTTLSPAAQTANSLILTVDPAQSTVHWSLESSLHTVHGTFSVKRGSVSVDPTTGAVTGEIVVDAASGQSGNDSRDHRMHNEILESVRYHEIIFRPDRVDGTIAARGSSSLKIHGIFSLHGADHDFTAPARAELAENNWKGSAEFIVPYIEWKLKNPSNFLLKVKPIVQIQLELAGSVGRSATKP
jgi:hypothetical protein